MNIDDFNRFKEKTKVISRIKECFHHKKEDCKGRIKQAHSIQRNGRLSIIENEVNKNLCLYCFTNFVSNEDLVMADLVPIGKKEASTFFGFCDYHDTTLFSPIENFRFDIDSDEHLFLHSYRSFAHSYHKKKEELNYWQNHHQNHIGNKLSYFTRVSMIYGNKTALNELEKSKMFLDKAIENKKYDSLEYFVYEKEGLFPFAVSSQMSPKVTYNGISMNNHDDPNIPYENPIITFLPDKESTFVIIAAFPHESKSVKLINELSNLNDLNVEHAITSLIIANCENTFFSPLFWNSLSKIFQKRLLSEFSDNTASDKYRTKFFKSSFNFFDDKFEINNLKKNAGSITN
ncbi:MAG: hypothetical protein QM564_03870 [Bergeyella sp.]